MRYAVDPRQMTLFEPDAALFSSITIKQLSSNGPGIFRYQTLLQMPMEALGKRFDANLGCPTKELYDMAGTTLSLFGLAWYGHILATKLHADTY